LKLFKSNLFIALCITLTIGLAFAWNQRWSDSPKLSITNTNQKMIVYYKKDRWTEQNWEVKSGKDNGEYFYGKQTPMSNKNNAWLLRNIFTFSWSVLIFLTLLFSVYGLIGKLNTRKI